MYLNVCYSSNYLCISDDVNTDVDNSDAEIRLFYGGVAK